MEDNICCLACYPACCPACCLMMGVGLFIEYHPRLGFFPDLALALGMCLSSTVHVGMRRPLPLQGSLGMVPSMLRIGVECIVSSSVSPTLTIRASM